MQASRLFRVMPQKNVFMSISYPLVLDITPASTPTISPFPTALEAVHPAILQETWSPSSSSLLGRSLSRSCSLACEHVSIEPLKRY